MKHQTKNRLEWLFIWSAVIFLIVLFLGSCKTPKDTAIQTKAKTESNTNTQKDLALDFNTQFDASVHKALEKLIEEKLQININSVDYDTDKPIDPTTGKPPIKNETNIGVVKNTNEQIKENEESKTSQSENLDVTDKSKEQQKVKTSTEQKEETTTGYTWWQKLLVSAIVFLLVVAGLVWAIKKLLKWKRTP